MRPVAANVPTATLARVCAGPCAAKHSSDKKLVIALRDAPAGATGAWKVNGAAVDATGSQITIKSFPADGSDVIVEAALTKDGKTGSAQITIPINAAPKCGGASCLSVKKVADAFGAAEYHAAVAGMTDDADVSELTYEWGLKTAAGRTPLQIDASNTFKLKGLPASATLYVVATDAHGAAAAEETFEATVAAPAEGFDAVKALSELNTARAIATKDPVAIGAAVRHLAALGAMEVPTNATKKFNDDVEAKAQELMYALVPTMSAYDADSAWTAAVTAATAFSMVKNIIAEFSSGVAGFIDASELLPACLHFAHLLHRLLARLLAFTA